MEYIFLGKLVNTHGIKGEVRILSNFEYKSKVFIPKFKLYIGEEKKELIINTYRPHKNFDMVSFVGINDIQDVLIYKGKKVYILKEDLKLNDKEYLDSDFIGLNAFYDNESIGKISDVINNNGYKLFQIGDKFIPYNNNFIESVDLNNKKIILKNMEGLL